VDYKNVTQTISGDFRSSSTYMTALGNNKTPSAFDYSYDANGNLVVDQNKDMGALNNGTGSLVNSGITYNYLNLPQTISFNNNKGTISYVYDAGGNKLQKITNETSGTVAYNGTTYNGVQITTTTSYFDGFVFQSVTYPNNATLNASPLQHGDILQFVGHEEGRIRPLYTNLTNSSLVTGYAFDYFIKDHLGNTRMMLTDEQATDPAYLATMETANATTEQQLFANLSQTRTAKPGGFDAQSGNQYVALTNYTTNKMGPSLVLKVMAGDMLNISVNAYYNATSGSNYNIGSLVAADLLTNLLSPASGIPALGGAHATLSDLQNNSSVLGTAGQGFLSSRTPPNSGVPKGYLNYIFLDDQFQYAGGYASPITSACATAAQTINGQYPKIAVPKNGYVYVYVSNESNYNVYFDNLQVVYQHGPILEDNAYYPFGLTMAGISDRAIKSNYAENKYRYNKGSELQNKEFSDGSGLEMYETHLRELDPQLGRWWQADSKTDESYESVSPYSSMNNDPIRFNDYNGDEGNDCCGLTFTWENARNKLHQDWDRIKEFAFDAVNSAGSTMNGQLNSASLGTWPTNPAQTIFKVNTDINPYASLMGKAGSLPMPFGEAPSLPGSSSFAVSGGAPAPIGVKFAPFLPISLVKSSIDPSKEQPTEEVKNEAHNIWKSWGKNRVTIPAENGELHFDLTGTAHRGVGTPHVQRSLWNTNPHTGKAFLNKDNNWVRPMTKADLKTLVEYISKIKKDK